MKKEIKLDIRRELEAGQGETESCQGGWMIQEVHFRVNYFEIISAAVFVYEVTTHLFILYNVNINCYNPPSTQL